MYDNENIIGYWIFFLNKIILFALSAEVSIN